MEIYLRSLVEEDALVSYKWRNNPEIWKYTGSRPDRTITPEIEMEWLRGALLRNNEKRFAICLHDEGTYIGNVQLTNLNNSSGEFHIFIGETKYWGMKIGYKATRQLIEKAFNEMGLTEVYLHVSEQNKAAVKAYLKCGFEISGRDGSSFQMICKKINA